MTHKIEEKLKIAILYDTWGDAPEAVEAKPPAKRKKAHKTRRKEKEDREEISIRLPNSATRRFIKRSMALRSACKRCQVRC